MEPIDVSGTIIAKSDQLNSDDLISGPITVEITGVRMMTKDQPIAVSISGGHQPWKPCKTMRRVLVHAWGADASKWVGRSLTLYRDASVKWAGDDVGGIRISAMSHIPKRIALSLAVTKGVKAKNFVDVLVGPVSHMSVADFSAALNGAVRLGWTREQIAHVLGCRSADVPPERRRDFAEALSVPPPKAEATPAEPSNQAAEAPKEA